MTHSADGGEALLEALGALEVEYIFSSPGSEWAPVWEALVRRESDDRAAPKYIDLWHETVAVGMATGYWLVSGRVQAVLLHAGAGLLQGASAIHGAQLSGAAMLVCSSESITYGEDPDVDPGSQWYRNLSVVGGPHRLVDGFTKWANQVGSSATLYEMVVRAGELAQRSPAGPVYLNIPLEVLLEDWARPKQVRPVPRPGETVSARTEIAEVAAMLTTAREPVVITETAGRDPAGFAALRDLCELLAIPVVEPQSAVCANFPRTHVLHGGSSFEPFAKTADVVLLVNCRAPWYPPSNTPDHAWVVVIDDVPQRPHIVYQVLGADRYLEGSLAPTLRELAEVVADAGFDSDLVDARRERHRAAHESLERERASTEDKAVAGTDRIDPVLVAKLLRELAPSETLYVDETITHSRVLQRHLQCDEPSTYLYVQGGLGQGMSVALGAKLGAPDRTVVLTIGDGSFLYNPVIPALAASRDSDLPILVVVFNNNEYLSMKLNHLRFYPEGAAVQAGRFHGVDLATQPELSSFAEPFGMHGECVTDPALLQETLERCFEVVREGRTAIVNVMVPR